MAVYNYICCFLVCLLCLGQQAIAEDKIIWLEADFPPFLVHEGDFAGQGYGNVITDLLIEAMDEYEHEKIPANISRHFEQFKKGANVCSVGLYNTPEREEFVYFSVPSFFTLPNVIVINKARYNEFGGTNIVKLADILEEGRLVIGRSDKRSYGQHIDALFEKYGSQQNVFTYEGPDLSHNFFAMLKKGRLDGVIGLPEEVLFQAERLGIREQIMTLAIDETKVSYASWLSHVACSKTEWGKEVIADVNKVLLQLRPTEKYRRAYERWLDDSSIEVYRKGYETHFLKAGQVD